MRFQKNIIVEDSTKKGSLGNSFEFEVNGYHPFSYYVLGGIDLSGDATSLNGNAESDDDSDLSSAVGAGYGYDPRISGFDIAEAAGTDSYQEARELAKTSNASSSDADTSETEKTE
jgi:hypothetical protein